MVRREDDCRPISGRTAWLLPEGTKLRRQSYRSRRLDPLCGRALSCLTSGKIFRPRHFFDPLSPREKLYQGGGWHQVTSGFLQADRSKHFVNRVYRCIRWLLSTSRRSQTFSGFPSTRRQPPRSPNHNSFSNLYTFSGIADATPGSVLHVLQALHHDQTFSEIPPVPDLLVASSKYCGCQPSSEKRRTFIPSPSAPTHVSGAMFPATGGRAQGGKPPVRGLANRSNSDEHMGCRQ
jgi:hypothetical protein